MAGGSGSRHTPLSKTGYKEAFGNLYDWCQLGLNRPNFIGILAVQWHGNQQNDWVPDYAVAAEYGWSPEAPAYDFDRAMARVQSMLGRLKDYTAPEPIEVDRSAWDGIWLDAKGGWEKDIMGLAMPIGSRSATS